MAVPKLVDRGPGRREAVLESAMLTFARFGYRKTSMEAMARAADISRPGLYFLFASKQELFRAAVTWTLERDLAAIEAILAAVDEPLPQRLLTAFDRWAGRYVGPEGRDITRVIDDNPGLLDAISATAPRRFEALITDAIAARAEFPTAERHACARDVAQTLISASVGLKHQASTRGQYRERLAVAVRLLAPGSTP